MLATDCVSSLVFDYSGHGRSTGPGTVAYLNADAEAAYNAFLGLFSGSERRCLLSHSLGAGPLVHTLAHATRKPDCVVLASPYSSLRDLAVRGGLPRPLRLLLPDVWDNAGEVSDIDVSLLWVHSHADATIPFDLGQRLFAAYPGPKMAQPLEGYPHNAIYQDTPAALWAPVLAFLHGLPSPGSTEPAAVPSGWRPPAREGLATRPGPKPPAAVRLRQTPAGCGRPR